MILKEFESIFRNDVAPLYIKHQQTFDEHCIHGCLHIARSLIICRAISNILSPSVKNIIDIDKMYYAIAFHDSGRIANGIDYWENNSSGICLKYLNEKGIADSQYIASLIVKDKLKNDYNYFCVHDTDVLEIMRPCTGVGVENFNSSHIILPELLNNHNGFMDEVRSFILHTESIKQEFNGSDSLYNLIQYFELGNNKSKYPTLYHATLS